MLAPPGRRRHVRLALGPRESLDGDPDIEDQDIGGRFAAEHATGGGSGRGAGIGGEPLDLVDSHGVSFSLYGLGGAFRPRTRTNGEASPYQQDAS